MHESHQTAELVHIDLGVAFEQGKLLPTPELVPFRLTRDIVDGMGVLGVEGVYRRCCEHTLEVLQNNHEALMTILDVFVHDPLYSWTANVKVFRIAQLLRSHKSSHLYVGCRPCSGSSVRGWTVSATAAGSLSTSCPRPRSRLLAFSSASKYALVPLATAASCRLTFANVRAQEKLGGVVDGVVLTVQGHVNQLIQVRATSTSSPVAGLANMPAPVAAGGAK